MKTLTNDEYIAELNRRLQADPDYRDGTRHMFKLRSIDVNVGNLSLPISLLGTVAIMYLLDYSLDNISLLAITLAVGLVVDVAPQRLRRDERGGHSPDDAERRAARARVPG